SVPLVCYSSSGFKYKFHRTLFYSVYNDNNPMDSAIILTGGNGAKGVSFSNFCLLFFLQCFLTDFKNLFREAAVGFFIINTILQAYFFAVVTCVFKRERKLKHIANMNNRGVNLKSREVQSLQIKSVQWKDVRVSVL